MGLYDVHERDLTNFVCFAFIAWPEWRQMDKQLCMARPVLWLLFYPKKARKMALTPDRACLYARLWKTNPSPELRSHSKCDPLHKMVTLVKSLAYFCAFCYSDGSMLSHLGQEGWRSLYERFRLWIWIRLLVRKWQDEGLSTSSRGKRWFG